MTDQFSRAKSSAAILEMMHDVRDTDIEMVVEGIQKDTSLFQQVMDGLASKDEMFRYNCFKTILHLSQHKPELVYSEWDRFQEQLDSDNAFIRAQGVHLLASLAAYDNQNRFEQVFEQYFGLLGDTSLSVTRYVAQNAAMIVRAKPHLQQRITEKLLDIDRVAFNPERIALIKSDILQSFDEYFELLDDKPRILAFAETVLVGDSPKARKAGKSFLKKYRE